MPITFYKPTSSYKAGAIKLTTGDAQTGNLQFRPDLSLEYFNIDNATPILSSPNLSSTELIYSYISEVSSAPIGMFIDSYTIGLSSTTSSQLTSIDINPSTRVDINSTSGVISISSMTPGNYRFNYYGKTADFLSFSSVTLSASIPVTILSSTMVQTLSPSWNLPSSINMPPLINEGVFTFIEEARIYDLSYRIENPSELDEIAAIYVCNTSQTQFALILERGFDESTYNWKFALQNNLTL